MSLITTPFGFVSTALDVVAGLDLSDRRAATSVLAATSPPLDRVRGRYFVDCNETEAVNKRGGTLHSVARYALDANNAARLWDMSETLVAQATPAPTGALR
jgi:hypothetical protein